VFGQGKGLTKMDKNSKGPVQALQFLGEAEGSKGSSLPYTHVSLLSLFMLGDGGSRAFTVR
jgi:hypothetical protein